MMTSTFWPDAAPPLPPPPPVALPEEVALPTTTPATTATRAIAATKDRENTVLDCAIALIPRVLGMLFMPLSLGVGQENLCRIRLCDGHIARAPADQRRCSDSLGGQRLGRGPSRHRSAGMCTSRG